METMESLCERLEALENQTRTIKRRLRCWRGIACGQTRRSKWRAHWNACLLLAALVVYALAPVRPGQAADFSCRNGDAACLITAINMANANGQANTITLKAGTYTLTAVDNNTDGPNGLPAITSELTIKGTSAATSILERDTSAPTFRILNVAAAGTLTLQGLTLRNGSTSFPISPVQPSGWGGGIFNNGTLTLIDCILTGNRAVNGGGLSNDTGTMTITHTTFDRNGADVEGGGLFNREGTVTIANSTFVRNFVQFGAGGIHNGFLSSMGNGGTMTLTNTTVAENRGGAAGGILNLGFAVLQSTTVAENSGFPDVGGIRNLGTVLLQNTIIARNVGGQAPDCSSATSLGNNLIGDPIGRIFPCDITLQPTDLTGDPGLGTFTDNGTPGNGHFPLLSTSQAIDAGNNAVCLRRDQLGRRRIGPCDIGAISFRDKDDGRHEEKDDHQHEENLVSRVRGSRW
jgi:hypothetical protein